MRAYYIPKSDICLFRPQEYFSENQGSTFLINAEGTTVKFPGYISFQFGYHKNNNLPMASSKNSAHSSLALMHLQAKMCPHPLWKSTTKPFISRKILLKWHWKLGHCGFLQVQACLRPGVNSTSILIGTNQTISS